MLEPGRSVRYAKLGAGRVVETVTRPFAGQDREFAVIFLPHRKMNVQVPIGDPAVSNNLFAVMDEGKLVKILEHMEVQAEVLPRTWDVREQFGHDTIAKGGPQEWANLLGSYAVAHGAGVKIASSDKTLVEQLIDLLAAELFCSIDAGRDIAYEQCLQQVKDSYSKVSNDVSERGASATHFEAVGQEELVDVSALRSHPVHSKAVAV